MSLLIKALASAEKEKQAEQHKRAASKLDADRPLALEPQVNALENIEMLVDDKPKRRVANRVLSLEEEAGFTEALNALKNEHALKSEAKSKLVKEYPPAGLVAKALNIDPDVPSRNTSAAQIIAPANKTITTNNAHVAADQKAAAKVFVANKAVKTPSSKTALALASIAGTTIILLAWQGYEYFVSVTASTMATTPAIVPPMPIQQHQVNIDPALPKTEVAAVVIADDENARSMRLSDEQKIRIVPNENKHLSTNLARASSAKTKLAKRSNVSNGSEAEEYGAEKEDSVSNVASAHKPLRLISKEASSGVDPVLLSAYESFNRGEDTIAQKKYRQVLQRDVRNVDALLGMAAIAQRQGRDTDAVGWYQKVLEIEPRNTIAQSSMINTQGMVEPTNAESRIKSMLAQQPEAANLHAALGNVYAEQNQWASAQEAYFNASRFASNNADYAFNLAVSLDQMGKTALALKHYQRALTLINSTGVSSPDKATLEARIQALQ